MKFPKRFLALLSVLCIFSTFVGCRLGETDIQSSSSNSNSQSTENSSAENSSEANKPTCVISAISPQESEEINIGNDRVSTWYGAYVSMDFMYSSKEYNAERTDNFAPKTVELEWSSSIRTGNYVVKVATNELLQNSQVYKTTETTLILKNLMINTQYYWQVETSFNNQKFLSDVYSFKTNGYRRTLDIEGVSNTRDLGGMLTSSGAKLKQGVVYRGANLNGISSAANEMMRKELKIKTILDLRSPKTETGGAKVSPLGQSINYINVDATDVYYRIIYTRPDVIKAVMKVFANQNNYPIYFHCAVGRDRTGSVAYLLGALCGVEEIELYKDFELTFFSSSGCSDFNSSDWETMKGLVTSFDLMNNYMYENFEGETLQEKTENYLLSIGLTSVEIQTIRNMLLDV